MIGRRNMMFFVEGQLTF